MAANVLLGTLENSVKGRLSAIVDGRQVTLPSSAGPCGEKRAKSLPASSSNSCSLTFQVELNWRPFFFSLREWKQTSHVTLWLLKCCSPAPKQSLQFVDPAAQHALCFVVLCLASPPFLSSPGITKRQPCNCVLSSFSVTAHP